MSDLLFRFLDIPPDDEEGASQAAPPPSSPLCLLRAGLIALAQQAEGNEQVPLPQHVLACPTCLTRFQRFCRAVKRRQAVEAELLQQGLAGADEKVQRYLTGVVAVRERLPLFEHLHGGDLSPLETHTMKLAKFQLAPEGRTSQRLCFEDDRLAGSLVGVKGAYRLSIEFDQPPPRALLELSLGWPTGRILRRFLVLSDRGEAHLNLHDVPPEDGVIIARPVLPEDLRPDDTWDLKDSISATLALKESNSTLAWRRWAKEALLYAALDMNIREVLSGSLQCGILRDPPMSLPDWLRQVSSGNWKGVLYELQRAWHDNTSNGGCVKAYREMLRNLSFPALKECLELAENDTVRKFLQEHIAFDPKDAERLHSALLAMLYTTATEHPAAGNDEKLKGKYWDKATHHWKQTVRPYEGDSGKIGSGQFGAYRDAAAELHGRPRGHDRERVTPILGCIGGDQGIVAWLHIERVAKDGTGEFYAHPSKMAFVLIKGDTFEAIDVAWRYATKKCFRTESCDVHWYLEVAARELPALEGDSLGAAMTVAALQLLRNERHDPSVALAATVDDHGNLGRVGEIEVKVRAAFSQMAIGITRVIVHPADLDDAQKAARSVNPKYVQAVVSAHTIDEALALMQPPKRSPWWMAAVAAVALLSLLALIGAGVLAAQRPRQTEATVSVQPSGPLRVSDGLFFQVDRYFSPTGAMGDIGDLTISAEGGPDRPLEKGAVRFTYKALGKAGEHGHREWDYKYIDGKPNDNPAKFVGCGWLCPAGNFGTLSKGGGDFRAIRPTKVTWEARTLGEPFDLECFAGSAGWIWKKDANGDWEKGEPPFPETLPRTKLDVVRLTREWQVFEGELPTKEFGPDVLSRVVCPFGWTIAPGKLNGQSYEFEIRNIRYEK